MRRSIEERVLVAGGIWGIIVFAVATYCGIYPFGAECVFAVGAIIGGTVAYVTTRRP